MAHKAKMKRKAKVVPCTDANQRQREHNALVEKKLKYERMLQERRMKAIQEQYENLRRAQMSIATQTPQPAETILGNSNDGSLVYDQETKHKG